MNYLDIFSIYSVVGACIGVVLTLLICKLWIIRSRPSSIETAIKKPAEQIWPHYKMIGGEKVSSLPEKGLKRRNHGE